MNPALDSRARFEAMFALAPYEFDMARWPENSTKTAWPGNYKFYHVQCAWEAWQAAIASMAASQWRPLIEAPVDDIVMVAAEFDGPGDWRIKCGYLDKQTQQWRVFGASWEPTRWQPLPAPPTPQDTPIAALAAKETKCNPTP